MANNPPPVRITGKRLEKMIDFLVENIENFPSELPTLPIADHAEANRIMPAGTPRPGPLDLSYSEYLREPLNNMSPLTPIQHTVIMKAAQGGFTMAAECLLCYYMEYSPADQLLISATEGLIERWAVRRLEPAIDSYGLRKLIYAQHNSKKSRRTGDKVFSKEYLGCRLDMASAQSASSMRSTDKRILVRDEIDGAPAQLTTGEGSWLDVSWARTNFWGDRRKVLDISTPTTFEQSAVFPLYLDGDQRKFNVKCPYCEKPQVLRFGSDKTQHGLKPDRKAGKLLQVYYQCEFCHDAIFEYDKSKMISGGIWIPTAESNSPYLRSYHWDSLLAPLGALPWRSIYELYEKALRTPDGMRSFINLYLGLPFKESGSRPKIENVIELKGGYRAGTVPDGVLYMTASVDVQRGSNSDSKNPARLEMEVCGHGAGFRTMSIQYYTFVGPVGDPYAGAWAELKKFGEDGGFKFKRKDGFEYSTVLIFIDSGDGSLTDVVYRFTSNWQNTFPIKGFSALKKRKTELGDEAGPSNFKRYRMVKIGGDTTLVDISTNYYKTHIYNNLKIPRHPGDDQRPGFCDFPVDYPEKYFLGLTAEEKRKDGSFHCPSNRRNEPLDLRVYNMCASDVYLDQKVMEYKAAAKLNGANALQLQQVNHQFVLELLKKKVQIDKQQEVTISS